MQKRAGSPLSLGWVAVWARGVLSVSTPTCTSVSSSGTGVVGGPGDVFTFGYQQEAGDAAVLYWSLYVIGKVLMSYLEVMS